MHLPRAFSSHLSSVPDSTTCLKLNTAFSGFLFFLTIDVLVYPLAYFIFLLLLEERNYREKALELLSHLITLTKQKTRCKTDAK